MTSQIASRESVNSKSVNSKPVASRAIDPILHRTPEIEALAIAADHIDIKVITSDIGMREFIANMFSYMPRWMQFLYAIRWFFVRLLGTSRSSYRRRLWHWPGK